MSDVRLYRGLERKVAKHAAVQAELSALAGAVAAVVRMVAGPHGSLASRVFVESGRIDRHVGIADPDIAAIEFGTIGADRKQVKGLHVLARAANMFGSDGKGH